MAEPNTSLALPLWLSLGAMAVNGMFGAAVARTRLTPVYGTLLAGVLVGLGGGMVRDVLLGLEPIAISDWMYIPTVLMTAVVGGLVAFHLVRPQIGYLLAQGFALGLLITIGTQKALEYRAPPISAIFLGVLTASAGGMITDTITIHRASVMGQVHWLASSLVLGTVAFWAVDTYVNFYLGVLAAVLIVTTIRVLSVRHQWPSPRFPGEPALKTT